MLTKDDYLARAEADDAWAPGWLAIDAAFDAQYPGVEPHHFGTEFHARAQLGGNDYLDGFSLFPSPHGYFHVLTYGMSSLYVDPDAFGGEFSGWGYEMTMKVQAADPSDCLWAIDSLSNIARYTYTSSRWIEPYQVISGRGLPLRSGSDTALTSYLVVPDTEIAGIDTPHGRVDFLQLVGITQAECDRAAGQGPEGAAERCRELAERLVAGGNPLLVTDLSRASIV